MIKSLYFLLYFIIFSNLPLFAQYEELGNTEMKNMKGYIFYSLDYDSSLKRFIQKQTFFITNTNDTLSVIGLKTVDAIHEKFPRFKANEFKNPFKRFKKNIYSLYSFSNAEGYDYLHGEFYENCFGQLFLVSKVYNRSLIFFNPRSNIFKLIHGNYYNKPPFIYMIKPKRELKKLTEFDVNKLSLKVSNKVKIPFDL